MAKIHIENGKISSSADYSLYHGTSPLATVEAGGLRVQGDVIAENMIVSSSTTYMTTSFSAGSTIFGDTTDDTHVFVGNTISGSSTSTGSFGSVHIADRLGIGTTNTFEPVVAYPDQDIIAIFGKAAFKGSSDLLYISHYDKRNDGVGYALRQTAAGATAINAASGAELYFKINNDTVARVNTHGLGINATPADDIRLRVGASDNDDGIQLDDQSGNSLFKVFQQSDGVGRMFLKGGGSVVFNVTSGADPSFVNVGRFGVGVTSPTTELDVSGSVRISGNIIISGQTDNLIHNGTSDASDNKSIRLDGGGGGGSSTRGAYVAVFGNEHGSEPGELVLQSGNVTGGAITFRGSGGTDMGVFTKDGDFGIGTTSPSKKLHIFNGSDGVISNFYGANADGVRLSTYVNDSSGYALIYAYDDNDGSSSDFTKLYIGSNDSGEEIVADGTGKLGIGTTSPSTMLHLKSSTSTKPKLTIEDTNADDNMGALQFIKDSASPGTGDKLMQIWAYGDNNAAEQILYSEIATLPTSVADGSEEGSMRFRVMSGGSFVETMRVRGNKVGIGTTDPAEALHVAGKAYIRRTGTATAHGDTDLLVADSTAGGSTAQLQILGGATGGSLLYFSDTNSYSVGGIKYFHSDNRMTFRANDTDILDITSTKISGSVTSTGSFGRVHVADKLAVGTTGPTGTITVSKGLASAPLGISASGSYLQLGTNDYGSGATGKFMIGFGYTDNYVNTHSPAYIGFEETATAGDTKGDLTFYTRNVTTDTAPTRRMTIDEDGNVGIGTDSPSNKLTVEDVIGIKRSGVAAITTLQMTGAGLTVNGASGYHPLIIQGNGTEFARVKSDGNVGIGTTSPDALLHVASSTSHGIIRIEGAANKDATLQMFGDRDWILQNDGDGTLGTADYFHLYDLTAGASRIVVDTSGNVLIGKTSSAFGTAGTEIFANGSMWVTKADGNPVGLNRTGGAGSVLEWYDDASIKGVLGTATSYFLNNVGIGTTSPAAKLEIQGANGTVSGTPETDADELVIRNNSDAGINILAGEGSGDTSGIVFGSTSDINGANIHYNFNDKLFRIGTQHASGILTLRSGNGTTAVTIDATQDATFANTIILSNNKSINFLNTSGAEKAIISFDSSNITKIGDSSSSGTLQLSAGTATFAGNVNIANSKGLSSTSFTSGFAGAGYRIDQGISTGGKTSAEFDNLTVRGTMSIYELLVQQVRATNGNLFISSTGKVDSVTHNGGVSYTLGVDTGEGSGHGFAAGDIIRMQRFNNAGTGASVTVSDLDIQSVSGTGSFTANLIGSTTAPQAGFEYVRLGNDGADTNRQGGIYLTADDSNAPFIDVFDEITAHSDFNTTGKIKTRMGKLSGITSPRFGTLSGFGFWASGSVYLEGNVNATAGNIGGWGISGNAITSSAGIISIDANTKRITINDGSNDRIYLGEVTGSTEYGLKIFDGTGTAESDLLVELGSARNQIVGWELTPGRFQYNDAAGSIALDAGLQQVSVFTGSINVARPKVVMGKLPRVGGSASDDRYGFAVFAGDDDADITDDKTYNVLITRDKARLAGWDLVPGNIQSDNAFGSVRLSSISQSLAIWTGSINEAQPKLVLGKLPLHDGTVDSPYGLAVFSGTGTVSGSEASASVLITANKARLAGWELVPGRLKSGTVADINGNQASIALGTGATSATATPADNLFFVSASSSPVFYVGKHFSYTDGVLKAGGWTIGNGVLQSTGSTADTEGITIDANIPSIVVHGLDASDGADDAGAQGYDNVRVMLGVVSDDNYGIKGYKANGNTLFEISSAQNIIAGWTINNTALQNGSNIKLDASAKAISVNDDTFGNTGIQLQYNSGTPRFFAGTSGNHVKYDGSKLIVASDNFDIDATGNVSMSGHVTAAGGQIATFSITSGSIDSNSSNTKRGLKLEPGESIRGYGNEVHSTTSAPGLFSFGIRTVAPPAGTKKKFISTSGLLTNNNQNNYTP